MNQLRSEHSRTITDLDRAAILLLSMGEENAAGIIKKLSRHEVRALSERMAKITNVTQDDVALILNDFFDCYRSESGVSGASRLYLERALDKAVGRKLARGMLDDIYGGALADDLRRLEWVPPELLARFLEQEHVQMQALLLAFLPPEQASAVIALFPKQKHDDILFRIASLREVSEHVMDDLRHTLEACIEYVGEQVGARVNGVEKVAEIMNRYNGNKAEVMELLKQHNAETAEAVQDKMYDFASLARQSEDVLAHLLNEIPDELWVVALKGCEPAMLDSIMSALPKRLAQVYRQQIEGTKAQTVTKVEAARAEIMRMIRQMMAKGEVDYRLYEEATLG
ncbi:flagellar motor switch protein FliG [Rheinheimera pacifica]|uniref:FliG C-terminal domain-containing protein n=1 Tax=Rheinheimera pacifica TaxID=173990 RepID=UPI000CAF0FA5|nr:FliG C-terminal domain-containing protein [Rheinheimera pacifica]MDR6984302.1 flagellar motor switch protein FliG [Rheinheimera pacifica]PKM18319.1 MAG: flagellar motor switch protein FliG [Gammaproteobacteria bacterium HGW-Gammaproteobacteria-15]